MTPGPIADYLRELERALRERHRHDPRIVDEAREHLADAAEDGVRRGLTRDAAERVAVERFGPPDLIARLASPVLFETVVEHWRGVTAATALAAILAGALSYVVLPALYRSESVIRIVKPPRAPFELDWSVEGRMESITAAVLSNARLDRILKDFGLGSQQQMRRNISIVIAPGQPDARDATAAFTVGFQSPDPQLSQKVTERLAGLFILENFEDQARGGRTIGDQFQVTKPASLPTDPRRTGIAKVTVSGAFAGLALSIAALVARTRTRRA